MRNTAYSTIFTDSFCAFSSSERRLNSLSQHRPTQTLVQSTMENYFCAVLRSNETSIEIPNSFYENYTEELKDGIILADTAGNCFNVFACVGDYETGQITLNGPMHRMRWTYNNFNNLMLCCYYFGNGVIYFLPVECDTGEFDLWFQCERYFKFINKFGVRYTPYFERSVQPLWITTLEQDAAAGQQPLDIPNHVIHKYHLTNNDIIHILMPCGMVESWRVIQYKVDQHDGQLHLMVGRAWMQFCQHHEYIPGDQLGVFECFQSRLFRIILLND